MEILNENSIMPQNVSLILGFFDGLHLGHQNVIETCPNKKRVLVTFSSSPAEYFGKNFEYIYSRNYNYKLAELFGVNFVYEQNFENLAQLSAEEYLDKLLDKFSPESITTGFNHTFGANRQGTSDFLYKKEGLYKYFCTNPAKIGEEIVSSTKIKEFLRNGEIEKANKFLTRNFSIKSIVIEGAKLGRKLGFPTANMKYPKNIVKIPYGVYKVRVLGMPAIMNWGIKPTIGADELVEVHIPNYSGNLYGKDLRIEIVSKIRDEKKFNNLDLLKEQIEMDVMECLK